MSSRAGTGQVRIGLIGQIVHDTIYRYGGGVTEDFGGSFYSIMALDALMGPDDVIYPMTHVGCDAKDAVRDALGGVHHLSNEGIVEDPRPNNRVELRYSDAETRQERISGGVSPLRPEELLLDKGFDGLLINLVSGRELAPETFSSRGEWPSIPVHLDLHSYLMGHDEGGRHSRRRPDGWEKWLDICDVLQLNREEICTVTSSDGEVFDVGGEFWERTRGHRFSCLVVTDGQQGSWGWYSSEKGEPRCCFIPSFHEVDVIDPTGSGDVFGAAFFLSWLRGESVERSMIVASRMAGFNCGRSGTSGLNRYLQDREAEYRSRIDRSRIGGRPEP